MAYQKKTGVHKTKRGEYNVEVEKEKARFGVERAGAEQYAKSKARLDARAQFQAERMGARDATLLQGQRQRRSWPGPVYRPSPYKTPTAEMLDPMHIYTLGSYNSPQPQQNGQQIQKPQPRYNLSHMHSLLGYNPNQQSPQPQQVQPTQSQLQVQQTPLQPIKRRQRRIQQYVEQPTQIQQAPKVNNDFIQNMLGFGSNTQSQKTMQTKVSNHKRRKVFNIFTGQYTE